MLRVIYFGTPEIAADVFEYLYRNSVQIVAVVTKPDKPKGRSLSLIPTPVKERVKSLDVNIPIFQPELVSEISFASTLEAFKADLFVVVAYGEIIKKHLLEMPRLACINLHASLLPKYRGAAPIQRAIMNGEKESGVTIMHMVKKMDAGDMIQKVVVPIDEEMTAGELTKEFAKVGSVALLEVIKLFENEKTLGLPPREMQNELDVTYAPKVELEDCQINWDLDAEAIHNLVRGGNPHPGAFCFVEHKGQKKRLKIKKTRVESTLDSIRESRPKMILESKDSTLIIGCGRGAIRILELQLEGKKAMSVQQFLQGVLPEITKGQFIFE